MPIRFRCAYCNQLMGIARRKAGQVVRCPKCAGQVVVPTDVQATVVPAPAAPAGAPVRPPAVAAFEQENFSQVFGVVPPAPAPAATFSPPVAPNRDYDVEMVGGPIEIRGIFLTPGLLTLAGVLIIILMGAAFFVGWMIGRA